MTTVVLHSGPVQSYPYGSGPATIVGDPNQWDDNDDGTYAVADTVTAGSTSPYAQFDAIADLSAVETVTITVRYSTAYPDGTIPTGEPRVFYYELWSDYGDDGVRAVRQGTDGVGHPSIPDDDATHEFTYRVFPASWMTPDDVAFYEPTFRTVLQSGALLNFFAGAGGLITTPSGSVTIYKVVLEVTGTTLAVLPPVARLWPRDDGLGISSAARIWPPPKANRIIGGYQ